MPVVLYIRDIPNNNNPDENAEEMMNLKAASLDFLFSRSKLARAPNGMLDNSKPKKNINKFPAEIIKNMPSNVERRSI